MDSKPLNSWQRFKVKWVECWQRCMAWLHLRWEQLRQFGAVVGIVRFSVLIPLILAAAVFFADQMVDILQAVGEGGHLSGPYAWLLVTSAFAGLTVWYAGRTMFRFRFASNPASDPQVHPRLKQWLPRVLGIAVPGVLALRVALLTSSSESALSLWIFAGALAAVSVVIGLYMIERRDLARVRGLGALADAEDVERRDLSRWSELPTTTRRVFWVLLVANLVALIGFMVPSVSAYRIGAPAILLLGLGLVAVSGSALVYMANHYAVPILILLVVWVSAISFTNDNHRVRVTAESKSHGSVRRADGLAVPSPLGALTVDAYFRAWWGELEREAPASEAPIPVFVVAAEGGGVRAAYWTAAVLTTLEDATAGQPLPFSRHVFAISGVSGGSVGAAVFDAVVARQLDPGRDAKVSRFDQVDRMLGEDFLSPTLGVALFPDLVQRFVPWPMFDDRAMALERSWERAWVRGHPHEAARFTEPFHQLWANQPHHVPLLFLNSTVVESGQRAVVSPLATAATVNEGAFAAVLSVGQAMGTLLPLSAAAHVSARFTYVSPAGLVDTGRSGADRWVRLVDGGYFDNSGAVTAEELVRAIWRAHNDMGAARAMTVVVLHLPNEPSNPSAKLIKASGSTSGRVWAGEALSPLRALLASRGARGAQAIEYLRGEKEVTLISVRPCRLHGDLPLGWVLSGQVREDMRRQLGSCNGVGAHCAAEKIGVVEALLAGKGADPVVKEHEICQKGD